MNQNSVCFLVFVLLLQACGPTYKKWVSDYKARIPVNQADYSNLEYWAAHPDKKDPSDSIPKPLRPSTQFDSSVDVFFLHPTTLTDNEDSSVNARLDDAELNAKTDYSTILLQASAFNEYRLFAPRYRQAHIRNYFIPDTVAALKAFEIAYQDVKAAFQYYLNHLNKGRPIIIASHSQGTTHAIRLLKEYFDAKPLQEKLVAAYLIGMYIPPNAFSNIKICETPEQTDCFCGWRTYKVNTIPEFVKKEASPHWVTNPLSWTTDTSEVGKTKNEGAILRKFNKLYTQLTSARISNGVLWTNKPKFPGSFLLKNPNYHVGDINLYYVSIRNNLRKRVAAYKKSITP